MQRHVLPSDLPNAIRHLEDRDFDRLLTAVLTEQKRRGRQTPVFADSLRQSRAETTPHSLTRGQVNAVRAAFKAGVTPSRIARQFGLSQSDVRKALAAEKAPR